MQKVVADNSRVFWDKDGKEGPDDPNTSISVLLKWMCEADNYSKYRGKNNCGTRKKDICDFVAAKINATGVVQQRTGVDVKKKINQLEGQMRSALDWKNSTTGAGLMTSSNAGERQSFNSTLYRKCKYFDTLEEIFCDRASGNPVFTSCSSRGTNNTNIFQPGGVLDLSGDEEDEDNHAEAADDDFVHNYVDVDDDNANAPPNVSVNTPSTPVSTLNALVLHGNASDSDLSRSVASVGRSSTGSKKSRAQRKKQGSQALGAERLVESFATRSVAMAAEDRDYKRAKMESLESDGKYKERLLAQMDMQDKRIAYEVKQTEMDFQMALVRNFKEMRDNGFSYEKIAEMFPDMVSLFPDDEKQKLFKNGDQNESNEDEDEDIYS